MCCSPLPVRWQCLENIKKLKKLTHLTLDGIKLTDGKFLMSIARECKKLTFLRLRDLGPDGKCCYYQQLVEALSNCYNLESLRLEQCYIFPSIAIFNSLKQAKKLKHLFISSERNTENMDFDALKTLVSVSKAMLFVCVYSRKFTKKNCAEVKQIFNIPKVEHSNVYIKLMNDMDSSDMNFPIKYYEKMIRYESWLCSYYKEYLNTYS